MELFNIIRQINDQNYPPWTESDMDDLGRLFLEYGYSDADQIPWWFARLFEDVLLKRKDKFYHHDTDALRSDMGSILIDIARRYRWDVDDYGEGVMLLFPRSKVRVFISREASDPGTGESCDSTEVSLLA